MKKRRIVPILTAAVILAACGTEKSDIVSDRDSETEEIVRESETIQDTEELDEPEMENFRELTQEELDEFTQFVQGRDVYGFLMSEYTAPSEVALGEVFYSGAGFSEELSEEEVNAYLAACDQEEMYTDCVKVKKSDAEALVQERLGCSLDELDADQIGVYLSDFNAYYHECGDTNYMSFTCKRGLVNGNVYTLDFEADADGELPYSQVQTILEKTEDGYRFIANQYQTH